ncbi:DUF1566 domain-containing protein [Undibacterium sp. Ji50W]|uniref:Lcl C-terminal domain-containing protein n=1 Tax=Undibacterium sp. Ji50W TaxID=3413041 RepID=UPI003BF15E04
MQTALQVVQAPEIAPKIGTAWLGGIYAGVIAGMDGQPDYHLIHAPAENELINVNWQQSITQATLTINGFEDWSLFNRREGRLLAINTPEGFDKDGWYWTSEQNAGNPDYAWVQYFDVGDQFTLSKSGTYRARAVRRVLIIQ